ncbi:hypothetical protein CDL12_07478 [Handroanthus impetiginosus]|uniref:RING-type E3 ubiquitin transferase n=1 Tax=Handroanthus impetiginosus TaxID=429701 RepID=A0A2G9HQQ2_9LAMI|nr:hypothetical protein CDL12_07478 [Handroanthus impetiginosus]
MGDLPSPPAAVTRPPPPAPRSNLPMLYYGLVVVGTAAIVLILYNFIIIKWCTDFTDRRVRRRASQGQGATSSWRFRDLNIINFVSSFKYKKDVGEDSECAVCLSAFEEGEELRQLPKCKHSFHAPCIDMWLYSHMDCPLCRSPVEPETEQPEHFREGLLGSGTLV